MVVGLVVLVVVVVLGVITVPGECLRVDEQEIVVGLVV